MMGSSISDAAYLRSHPKVYLHLRTLFTYIHHVMTDHQITHQTFMWDEDTRDSKARAILRGYANAAGVVTTETKDGFIISRPT